MTTDAWPLVPLGNILAKSNEWIDLRADETYKEVTVRLWGKGVTLRGETTGTSIAANRRMAVRTNQFILSRIDARNGAFGLVPDSLDGAVVSTDFPVFTVNESLILPVYLNWMSKTADFVDLCKAASEGTTNRVRLKEDRFLAMQIALPPLDEQRRIVARIEALATKIEEARGLRRLAVEEAEALPSSYLSAIAAELSAAFESRTLDSLLTEAGYGTSVKCDSSREAGAVPVLRIPNVASERVTFADLKYGQLSESEIEKVALQENDVLVVRTNGSAELVGRCAVVPALPETTAFASYMIRLRCDPEVIDPHYLQLNLRHQRTAGHLFDFARTTAGQYNVSLGRLRTTEIPMPPLEEQRRMVAYLDSLQAKVDALKQLQSQTQVELDALLPSVLDKVFKGEL